MKNMALVVLAFLAIAGIVAASYPSVHNGLVQTRDGLWIEGPDNKMVAIYSISGQTAIGLYGKDKTKAMPIALSVDDNDEPYIQIRKGDKVLMLTFDDLASLKKK